MILHCPKVFRKLTMSEFYFRITDSSGAVCAAAYIVRPSVHWSEKCGGPPGVENDSTGAQLQPHRTFN